MQSYQRDSGWLVYEFIALFLGTVLGAIAGLLATIAALRALGVVDVETVDDLVPGIVALFGMVGGGLIGGVIALVWSIWSSPESSASSTLKRQSGVSHRKPWRAVSRARFVAGMPGVLTCCPPSRPRRSTDAEQNLA